MAFGDTTSGVSLTTGIVLSLIDKIRRSQAAKKYAETSLTEIGFYCNSPALNECIKNGDIATTHSIPFRTVDNHYFYTSEDQNSQIFDLFLSEYEKNNCKS